jgi:hypothetical protein
MAVGCGFFSLQIASGNQCHELDGLAGSRNIQRSLGRCRNCRQRLRTRARWSHQKANTMDWSSAETPQKLNRKLNSTMRPPGSFVFERSR